VSDLGIHRTRPKGTYFKSNYGRWAPLVIFRGTEATALSTKTIWLNHYHLMPLKRKGHRAFGKSVPLVVTNLFLSVKKSARSPPAEIFNSKKHFKKT
jgi:hypothetical protein